MVRRLPPHFRALFVCVPLVVAACCDTGGGGTTPPITEIPSFGAVYLADQDQDGRNELYLTPLETQLVEGDAPGTPVKLNHALGASGEVSGFVHALDGTFVVYRARDDDEDPYQLYWVDLSDTPPAAPVRLDADDPGREVDLFAVSPDLERVVYSQGDSLTSGLYEVQLGDSGPSAPERIDVDQEEGVAQSTIEALSCAPNGTSVAFLRSDGFVSALLLVDLSGAAPADPVELSDAGADVVDFFYAPDATTIAWRQAAGGLLDAYLAVLTEMPPGPAIRFNDDQLPPNAHDPLRYAPSSLRIAYTSDPGTGSHDVSLVELVLGPGLQITISDPVRLNDPLQAGASLSRFEFAPDSTRLAYVADQEVVGRDELYLVELETPVEGVAGPIKLNTQLPPGGLVNGQFSFSPDASRVVYRAEQITAGLAEVFLVDLADIAAGPLRLNTDLPAGGGVRRPVKWTADGTRVIYRADQETFGVNELYLVDATGTPNPTRVKISGPLTAGGNVTPYNAFSPAGENLLYLADQDTDETFELYLVRNLQLAGLTPTAPVKINGPLTDEGDVTTSFTIRP